MQNIKKMQVYLLNVVIKLNQIAKLRDRDGMEYLLCFSVL